ncbi:hypothetical protein ACFP3I_04920 [Chryseobacterium arachidis]|uniref:hypothetical protein n=1 Tax=Chryseobacterium arachidis TaxID=1416778 RepID=UPI00360E660D
MKALWQLSILNQDKENPKDSISVTVGVTYGKRAEQSNEPEGFNIIIYQSSFINH